jgi:aryl-alcohol dehydrogenase-like predicted oxidoreductase
MTSRREFIRFSGAAFATMSASVPMVAQAADVQKLPARPIPGTDESLSIVGLGTSSAFRAGDTETTRSLLDVFTNFGGSYIDVGGNSGPFVSKVAAELGKADGLFLGDYVDAKPADALAADVRSAAAAQGNDALDLIHTRDIAGFARYADQFAMVKEEGLVRYVGIARSGQQSFAAIMQLIEQGVVDFVQVNYSLLEPEAADRLLPLARDKGVAVNINRPFINGRYFSIVQGKALPEWAADFDCHSWAQFSLKFILANPAVNCVLTETTNPKHAVDNLEAGLGKMPDMKTQQMMLDVMRGLV